jgi:1,4-dihydroxy-2-naphthoate octaprenyltransferase
MVTQTASNRPPNEKSVNALQAWRAAVRPPSLLVAIAPVMVGTALGYHQTGNVDGALVAMALLAAVLMQVITNLQNDVGYTERGAERIGQRMGLPRATALGWLTVRQVKAAIVVFSAAAILLGLGIVWLRGWPVLALGSVSLLAALAYMGGPRPIAYTPWGEATVFLFFGPVAVLGTGWLLTGGLSATGALASVAVGSIAAAALAVNNYRDMEHDTLVGRRTFAVTFGEERSRQGLAVLLAVPFLALAGMAWQENAVWPLAPWVLVPAAKALHRDFARSPGGLAYNGILFRTFRLGLWFALLLSVSAVLSLK